ncbi:MAG: hypothetical protein AMXMBFR53_36380 [Gemmatimonadota bacterium]
MAAREIVLNLVGPRLDAVEKAYGDAVRAEAMLREVIMNQQIAKAHLTALLVAATNEPPAGLRFDSEQGVIYREIEEPKGAAE